MNGISNLIWLVFGGLWSAIGYMIGGFILCCTIIGIPFGIQCFKIAGVMIWPFGKEIVNDSTFAPLTLIFNIIWLVCGGIWIAAAHLFFGVLLCITIIGIPFGVQHFKLIELSLMPFGKKVYSAQMAR